MKIENKHIHIVSFAVPFPADYGGVIEVFHKIKALHKIGVKIHLHCFLYDGLKRSDVLEEYCEEVYYYDRVTGWKNLLKWSPYIVISRKNPELLNNLLKDKHPILFEGVHSTAFINHSLLKDRKKFVRMANIESNYYKGLLKASTNWMYKLYYAMEAMKLSNYEKRLQSAEKLIAISKLEYRILGVYYGEQVAYIPPFHPFEKIELKEIDNYILYHGNLKVEENDLAAHYLVENIFSKLRHQCIIAGKSPSEKLKKLIAIYDNISLVESPDNDEMQNLVQRAKVNVLFTEQSTGLKLKLLNVLFNGHAVIVNRAITEGTLLNDVVVETNDDDEMIFQIDKAMLDHINTDYETRQNALSELYDNSLNAEKLSQLIFS